MYPRIFFTPDTCFKANLCFSFEKRNVIFHFFLKSKKVVFIDLCNTVSHAFIFTFVQYNQKWKVVTKNKMDNPRFIDEETIPMVQDEDYDDYDTPNTIRVDETLFTEPDATEATLTLQLKQRVKRDKITPWYRYVILTSDQGLTDIDRFMIKKKFKNRQH